MALFSRHAGAQFACTWRSRDGIYNQAFAAVFEDNNKTCVWGRNGTRVELMDDTIKRAHYYVPQSPLSGDPVYLIETGKQAYLRISEKDFSSDKRLINAIQQQGMIRTGVLHTCRKDRCPNDKGNVVVYDDDHLYFTSSAFATVCKSMIQSRPVILDALSNEGLISGAPINSTTTQSRIRVRNGDEENESGYMSVYSLLRNKFEDFGDSIILEEEGD